MINTFNIKATDLYVAMRRCKVLKLDEFAMMPSYALRALAFKQTSHHMHLYAFKQTMVGLQSFSIQKS